MVKMHCCPACNFELGLAPHNMSTCCPSCGWSPVGMVTNPKILKQLSDIAQGKSSDAEAVVE
jgi:hypothetical protein